MFKGAAIILLAVYTVLSLVTAAYFTGGAEASSTLSDLLRIAIVLAVLSRDNTELRRE